MVAALLTIYYTPQQHGGTFACATVMHYCNVSQVNLLKLLLIVDEILTKRPEQLYVAYNSKEQGERHLPMVRALKQDGNENYYHVG